MKAKQLGIFGRAGFELICGEKEGSSEWKETCVPLKKRGVVKEGLRNAEQQCSG